MTIDTADLIKALEERKRQLSKWTAQDRAKERIDEIECIIDTDVPYLIKEESKKPVPNDLEEAARNYTDSSDWSIGENLEHIDAAFIAGYNLCKEQMLKEAVEGEVMLNPYPTICLDDCKDYDFKDGQKVRIIIVKE